ncbi:phage terminase large subunit family protein [Mesorhizobium sp. AR07]|uniref:phage terminase large subunit family protein n=1 Tax=Mesorhizobium sp. AR07 TaxID=2865838 RepID=UPI0021603EE1|nr:phage terminase large subunit family protein [Mesorhizobium sp. AR07]UVK46829.1 phage terminase large subunit family protein [Mesorhizobium sp. AR07]
MTARMRPPSVEELIDRARHQTIESIVVRGFESLQPAARMTVTEAGEAYTRIGSGGGHSTPWSLRRTPYLQEPQDELNSLEKQGMIFIGPARTGKTMMSLNWLSHTVKTDPADMLYVHMDRENARKWSKGDLERYLQASTKIREHQLTNRKDDNTFDKEFDSGMRFILTYPTSSNLSGITVGRVWLIDYERMDDNVDGEGNPFDLAQMRTTTFKRFGMTVAEASPNPNKEIQDPKWTPSTPHEAPPIRGIFELYNRGDRRRWYWKCPHCTEAFEPDFKLLRYPEGASIMEAREQTYMACPVCGGILEPDMKDELNWNGRWVKEGMIWTPEGAIVERNGMKAERSSIASFWMKGPAAAYQDWGQLVEKNLRALKAFEDTGDDGPLRKTVTTDQGSYYIPQGRLSERSPEDLKNMGEDWGSTEDEPSVPHGVRFQIATVDVQKAAFVVQVHGFTATGDMVVIDGFKLRLSNRLNGAGERLPIDPAAFAEDWDVLIDGVILKTYPLADGSGRRMRIRATGGDSGGAEGVTGHAYNFWRRLRKRADGLHRRFCLVKGESSKGAPHARTTWPDSSQKGKLAIAKGDVPVILLHSNLMKDRVATMLARRVEDTGEDETVGGMLRYPDWMPGWFYNQMTTEIRTDKGWENPRKRRNETFDLAYYALGLAIRPIELTVPYVTFNIDRINYDEPPSWAAEWDANDMVFGGEAPVAPVVSKKLSLAELGKLLA